MARILVIDDDPGIRGFTEVLLTAAGHEVLLAEDASAGWETICAYCPDLVVLDLLLPGVDGWDVLRKLRADPDLDRVRVLVFTAFQRPSLERDALSAGAAGIVFKPIGAKELMESISRVLSTDE